MLNAPFELLHQLMKRGSERVIGSFRKDVRSRSDQLRRQTEWGTRLGPAFNQNAGFIDTEDFRQESDAFFNQSSEGGRGLMGLMFEG
jgi:hypothetical protein